MSLRSSCHKCRQGKMNGTGGRKNTRLVGARKTRPLPVGLDASRKIEGAAEFTAGNAPTSTGCYPSGRIIRRSTAMEFICLAIVFLFFGLSAGLVRLLERL
jgi:hypothetical protein